MGERCLKCFNFLKFCTCYVPKLPEPVEESEYLAPPGSRAVFHDSSTKWHADQLHIEGVDNGV